jgi:hypothetical protein
MAVPHLFRSSYRAIRAVAGTTRSLSTLNVSVQTLYDLGRQGRGPRGFRAKSTNGATSGPSQATVEPGLALWSQELPPPSLTTPVEPAPVEPAPVEPAPVEPGVAPGVEPAGVGARPEVGSDVGPGHGGAGSS